MPTSKATIRAGIGGWTFEPWRGTFYPDGLAQAQELAYASRQLPTIEINGTYYRTQSPATFRSWRDATPEGFVFSVKGPRYATNRGVLAEAGESVSRFVNSGVTELGDRLGPILWQLAPTKRFDDADIGRFLELLPAKHAGIALRHVIEPRHASFQSEQFVRIARDAGVGIVLADHATYPMIADVTAGFVYARLMRGVDEEATGYSRASIGTWAGRIGALAKGELPKDLPRLASEDAPAKARDVFVYFIDGGKLRAPAAAAAFMSAIAPGAREAAKPRTRAAVEAKAEMPSGISGGARKTTAGRAPAGGKRKSP